MKTTCRLLTTMVFLIAAKTCAAEWRALDGHGLRQWIENETSLLHGHEAEAILGQPEIRNARFMIRASTSGELITVQTPEVLVYHLPDAGKLRVTQYWLHPVKGAHGYWTIVTLHHAGATGEASEIWTLSTRSRPIPKQNQQMLERIKKVIEMLPVFDVPDRKFRPVDGAIIG
jgi:hypothetical protein